MHEFFKLLCENRNYRYTWTGQIVSEIGDNFNNIAVFALAMALTHSGLVITGVLLARAIPAIAFLVVVLPYLGLGFVPALVALTVLGITPILVNTFTGIQGIDPAAIDAAHGIGMTPYQIMRRVQIPLVLPVIAAGVRTAAIQIIATATLAGIIGAGGYGEYIYSGLYQLDNIQILAGALPVTILAILAEVLLSQLQRVLTPKGLRIKTGSL